MHAPTMGAPREVAAGVFLLPSHLPLANLGVLPVNAFLLQAAEPVLLDTGMAPVREEFLRSLRSLIDLGDLRWIYVTHADADHVGNLRPLLAEAPRARVVTTFLGLGKMNLAGLGVDRFHLLNPGQSLDIGDRRLSAFQPAVFDAPETTCVFDDRTGALFSADWFGALLPQPAETAADVAPEELRRGQILWATVDAPWLSIVREGDFRGRAAPILELGAHLVLSAHLPPASGLLDAMMANILASLTAPAFVGPDQAAVEQAAARG